jgi:hypothetical protein
MPESELVDNRPLPLKCNFAPLNNRMELLLVKNISKQGEKELVLENISFGLPASRKMVIAGETVQARVHFYVSLPAWYSPVQDKCCLKLKG